ncbi:MAG: hypothetical protein U0T32_01125 [Chitinophagales bacterium]
MCLREKPLGCGTSAREKVTGAFTGAYALNLVCSQTPIPIYIAEYVLAQAMELVLFMAVPADDERE